MREIKTRQGTRIIPLYRIETTDGDSGHPWEIVDTGNNPIEMALEAARLKATGDYRYSGGIRLVKQKIVGIA